MKIVISFSLEPEHVRKLEALAAHTGLNRSDIMRKLIDTAEITPPVPAQVRTARLPKPSQRTQSTE